MHAVLTAFRRVARDGAVPKLILVGDRDQLQAVGAGSGLRLVAETIEAQRVEAIQRQKEPWLRDAILSFGRGEASAALKAFADRGFVHHRSDRSQTITALVDRWQESISTDPTKSILMIAATNADVRAISLMVRQRLRRQGVIHGDDVTIAAASPSGHDVKLPLAPGDRIRFLRRAELGGHEVINGTEATVLSVVPDSDRGLRIVARAGDRMLSFTPAEIADERGRARIAHAYASTIHGAQGLTTDRALVLVSPDMDRHAIYVAASRARAETTLFVDDRALDVRMRSERPLDAQSATASFEEVEHLAYLDERLSRSGVKRTTLDFRQRLEAPRVSPTPVLEPGKRNRSRSRGLDLV